MTSTRLPGKVLQDIQGRAMLARVVEQLRRCAAIDEICVATTVNADDEPVVALANELGVRWHRGSEHDVLARYEGAAREAQADLVVRITSDCPLLDPRETARVVRALEEAGPAVHYASNVFPRTYPRGLDVEALWRTTLDRVSREATSVAAREHVTWTIVQERPADFARTNVSAEDGADDSDLRWTVDTPEDLQLVRRLYSELDLGNRDLPYREVVRHMRADAGLLAINAHVEQKAR